MSYKNYFSLEPIEEEVVNFAEDFYFKLSEGQLKIKSEALKKRQMFVFNIIEHFGSTVNPKCKDFIYIMGLMIDYCYNKFYFPIPLISKKKVLDYANVIQVEGRKQIEAGNNVHHVNQELADLNQAFLVDAIAEKVFYYEHSLKLIGYKDNLAVGYVLHSLLVLYNSEVVIRQSKMN